MMLAVPEAPSATLGRRFRLSAAIENITAENYRIHGSGLNEPGLNLVVTLGTSF